MFVCYYRYVCIFFDILQGNVEMHLWCSGMCNNHIIANCLQSVPVKELINDWRRYRQKLSATFCMAHPVVVILALTSLRYNVLLSLFLWHYWNGIWPVEVFPAAFLKGFSWRLT